MKAYEQLTKLDKVYLIHVILLLEAEETVQETMQNSIVSLEIFTVSANVLDERKPDLIFNFLNKHSEQLIKDVFSKSGMLEDIKKL